MKELKMKHIVLKVKRMNTSEGFTLLEVIVAISILTVGLLAVASMQVSSIRGNSFAYGVTEGTSWAADRMEKLVALGYDNYDDASLQDTDGDGDAGLDNTGFDDVPSTAGDADHGVSEGNYNVFWNISENSLLQNTKTVNVIVTWLDHGDQKNISMQYVIPKMN
jgi:prepilin-type N-terminal cleavage/methylation domain-containing protein